MATMAQVITVAADKGGVGKTTLAYELAACFDGVLVDLDWASGGAAKMWGHDPAQFKRVSLLDAFERGPGGPPPRPRRRVNQPALVPSHPDLAATAIEDDLVADCLEVWAKEWNTTVIVDTHPGTNALTDGAMVAANLVVVPAVLAQRELDGLEGMLPAFRRFPLLLVPNMVPPVVADRTLKRFKAIAGECPIAPPVSRRTCIQHRLRRAAIVLQPHRGKELDAAAGEYRAVAATVEAHRG